MRKEYFSWDSLLDSVQNKTTILLFQVVEVLRSDCVTQEVAGTVALVQSQSVCTDFLPLLSVPYAWRSYVEAATLKILLKRFHFIFESLPPVLLSSALRTDSFQFSVSLIRYCKCSAYISLLRSIREQKNKLYYTLNSALVVFENKVQERKLEEKLSLGTIDFYKNVIYGRRIYFGIYLFNLFIIMNNYSLFIMNEFIIHSSRILMNESKARHKCSVTQTLPLQKEKTNLEIIQWQIFPGDAVVENPPAGARDAGLENEVTSPSSILAWKISWTEDLGGRQSIGQQSQTSRSMHTQNSFRNFVSVGASAVLHLHKIQSSKWMYSSYFLTSHVAEDQEELF